MLTGGDYHSKSLIVNAGQGTADGVVGDVTGMLKVSAGIAHIGASTANLIIGDCSINGDPTFYNDAGDITLSGILTFTEAIAILASGDVTDNGASVNISATDPVSGLGKPVTIIAGASLKAAGGGSTTTVPGTQLPANGFVTVGKASKTGGSVNLLQTTINTKGTGNGEGGDVMIIALAGKGGVKGEVGFSSILTGGAGTGKNGSVSITARGAGTTVINAGNIDTTGGAGAKGNISMATGQPLLKLTFNSLGLYTGTPKAPKRLGVGGISTAELTSGGGNINISSGGSVTLGTGTAKTSAAALAAGTAGGNITVKGAQINVLGDVISDGDNGAAANPGQSGGNGGKAGDITMLATDKFTSTTNFIRAVGGNGTIGSDGVGSGSAGGDGGSGGGGGNISITAGGDISVANQIISSSGKAGNGGKGIDGASGATGGTGGKGGAGGNTGSSGNIALTSDGGNIVASKISTITLASGSGGAGGAGGTASGDSGAMGGAGGAAGGQSPTLGAGGAGGNGGDGGDGGVVITSSTSATTDVSGGNGGAGGIGPAPTFQNGAPGIDGEDGTVNP